MKTIAAACAALMLASTTVPVAHAANEAALYRQADRNGNGSLDKREFRTFIQALAKSGNRIAKRVRFWGVYGMAFRMTDANRDGELTAAELQRSARENADKVK